MGSKLKEVTFGTPIVLKVNNTAPDTNGNVTVQVGVTGIESTASGVKKIAADSSCGMTFYGCETHCGYEKHDGRVTFGSGGCEYHCGYEYHHGEERHCGYEYHHNNEYHFGREEHCGCEYHYGSEVHHGNITFTSLGTERHEGSETHCGDISFGKGTVTFTSCGGGGFVYFDGGCACAGDGYGNANILVTAIAFRGPNGEIKVIDYDKVKNL